MKYTNKQIWLIAYPILISLLMEHLIGFTDTAFLGRVGEVELGASALASVYFAAIFMLELEFSIGTQIMMARRHGEESYREIGSIFQQGVLFMLVLATLMFAASSFGTPWLLGKIISSKNVYEAADSYLKWRIVGFFFAFLSLMFRAFFVAITKTKIMTINSIVMVLSNVLLNYGLIFGKFGLPELGIAGAAIASTFAELVSVIFYVLYTWKRVDWKKYGLLSFHGVDLRQLGQVLSISVWMMIQSFLAVVTWFLFFLAIEHHGERPLAITNIIRSISTLIFMTINAFASTSSTLAGNLMGQEKPREVMPAAWQCVKMSYKIVLPLIAVIAIVPQYVMRIYTDDWAIIQDGIPGLRVMLAAYLVSTPGFVLFNTISGTGNTRSALLIEFVTLFLYMIYVWYIAVYHQYSVAVCWTSEWLYGGLLCLLSLWYLRRGEWQRRVI